MPGQFLQGKAVKSRQRQVAEVAAAVALLLLVIGALAGFRLWRIANRLENARAMLDTVEASVRQGNLGQAQERLDDAQAQMLRANGDVHSPELGLVAWLPVVTQNMDALRASVEIGLQLVNGGQDILTAARPLADANGRLQVPLSTGAIPVPVVVDVQRQANVLATTLPGRSEQRDSPFLLPTLSRLQDRVFDEAVRRKSQFESVGAGLQLLADMAGANGPRRYLIAVSNAAEMRGTGGMILSYAILTSEDGSFTLDKVGPIDELRLPDNRPAAITNPPDYFGRFAGLNPNIFWRNANPAADFTAVAPVLEEMFRTATGDVPDGVIQIDSDGLAAVLRGIGPVDVAPLGLVTGDNAVALTLNEAYVQFPERAARQDHLESVARATFEKLFTGAYPSVRPLAAALVESAAGRHILMHSNQRQAQRAVVQLGIDGGLPDPDVDFAHLTVQNLTGNKLDYYLDTRMSVQGTRPRNEPARVRATIDVTNTAPANGVPPYIFGPYDARFQNGQYRGLVSVYLPRGTRLAGSSGDSVIGPVATGSEDGRTTISYGISLQAGQGHTRVLDLVLPSRPAQGYEWVLVPSPRVRPTSYELDLAVGDDRLRATGELRRTVAAAPRR